MFHNYVGLYGEGLSAPRPTPILKDHPLSAARDRLFNIFAATLHIGGRSSIRNPKTRHAVVIGTHLSWFRVVISLKIAAHRMAAQLCLNYGHAGRRFVIVCWLGKESQSTGLLTMPSVWSRHEGQRFKKNLRYSFFLESETPLLNMYILIHDSRNVP
jgi:hypothetical protein